MLAISLFRTALMATFAFAMFEANTVISLPDPLPPFLQDFFGRIEGKGMFSGVEAFFLFGILICLFIMGLLITHIVITLYMCLWRFESWARTTYILISILIVAFYPASDPVVMNAWETMLSYIPDILWVVSLVLLFSPEIDPRFEANKFNFPHSPESQNPQAK